MKFLHNLTKKTLILQRTIGLKENQFYTLVNRLEQVWEDSEKKRKSSPTRKRAIGAGNSYKHESLKDKLLIVLLYYKLYVTQEFLGVIVDLDQANISRLLKKMLPLIEQAADPELALYLAKAKQDEASYARINNLQDFFKIHPDLEEVIVDATEQECYRSEDNEQQKKYYSGKRKAHMIKTQVTIGRSGRIIDISESAPGSIHDKKLFDQEDTINKFPKKTRIRGDSGYQGAPEQHPDHYIIIPIKKPKGGQLSDVAKESNRANSKRRVVVEHAIGKIKHFRMFNGVYRGKIENYNQSFRNAASILNFRLKNNPLCV